ncbi:MAG: 23S rRNA (uracil(1939)-C(5))-methyltransferase RlmD [Bacteroidetes bacterium]|nr:23S rRNA (uracil(1939)-C(5))-methyltransferase RlmD [Bacteroidota bacterium]
MKKRRNKPVIIENLEILDAGSEGKAVGRFENRVVFVPYAVPGDVCDIMVIKSKNNYMEGRVDAIKHYSDKRMDPRCIHFGVCGGCKWQNMQYQHQLFYKQKQVEDNLRRIGHLDLPKISPILPSEDIFHYRNKMEYTFMNRKWFTDPAEMDSDNNRNGLGFHLPGKFDKILDLKECHLQDDTGNRIRLEARKYALEHNFTFHDIRSYDGFLRNLIIRNTTTGEWMVILITGEDRPEETFAFLDHLKNKFPEITSLQYVVNPKHNPDISDLEVRLYHGSPWITEKMGNLVFRIGPKSFFQTNSHQAFRLYQVAIEFAGLTGKEVVYDLYTGTGTIATFLAGKASKVIGIENVEAAVEDARVNAEINGISNVFFFAGDIASILDDDFTNTHGKPQVIITDPPRSGMVEKVIRQILEIQPGKIVYISCNPATQARDLAILSEKYKITRVQPVDMFPHTQHVENVVLLGIRD